MNRISVLSILILVVSGLVILVFITGRSGGPPEQVSAAAESYAHVLTGQMDRFVTVRRIVRAANPGALRPEMSALTYSDSLIFRTSFPLAGSLQPGGRGIAYPPQEAWCASLTADNQTGPTIVVIARHQDLYNSDWIVHTLVDPAATTVAIRCKVAETYD
jgi:hypothetical protein